MSPAIIAGILLLTLTLAASVVLLGRDVAGQKLARRIQGLNSIALEPSVVMPAPSIRRAQQNRSKALDRCFMLLGYRVDNPDQYTIGLPLVLCCAGAVGSLTWFYGSSSLGTVPATLSAVADSIFAARGLFRYQSNRYAAGLLKQLPDAIGLIVRGSSVGVPVAQSLRSISREIPNPTGTEFATVVRETAIGTPLEEAVWNIYKRTGLTEYSFLAVALGLQQQSGGNLSETLDNLADLVRNRLAAAGRAKALSAESRMAAMILIIMPFAVGGLVSFANPHYMAPLFSPRGSWMLKLAAVLMSSGILSMRWFMKRASQG